MKKLVYLLVFLLIFGNGVSVFAITQSQVDQESAQIQNLKSEITRLDTQINGYETQINTLNSQIESTNQQLLEAQQQEEQMVDESEKRMKAAYMYGDTGYLEYLFSADSPSDFISYFDITKEIVTDDKARVNEIKQKKTEIQNLQNQLTNQRAQVLGVKQQSEALRTQKEQTLTQNQATLAQLQQQLSQQQLNDSARTSTATPVASVPVTLTNNINVLANGNTEPRPLTAASTQSTEQAQQTGEATTTEDPTAEATSAESDNQQYIVTQTTTVTESSGGEETVTSESTDQTTVSGSQYLPSYIQDLLGLPSTVTTDNQTNSNTTSPVEQQFSGSWVWPLDVSDPNAFTITSVVGHRESPGGVGSTNHEGTDIGASYGTAILAASPGTVTTAGTYGGYGNCVMIDHGNGYTTLYGHMSSVAVNTGDVVTAGQVIGFVGSTGWSTGPHLHFEVRYDDNGNSTIVDGLTLYDSNIIDRLTYAL